MSDHRASRQGRSVPTDCAGSSRPSRAQVAKPQREHPARVEVCAVHRRNTRPRRLIPTHRAPRALQLGNRFDPIR